MNLVFRIVELDFRLDQSPLPLKKIMTAARNQLYLIFSPKSLPIAELIYYSVFLKDTQQLKLGLHRNLLLNQAHLIVTKGIFSWFIQ